MILSNLFTAAIVALLATGGVVVLLWVLEVRRGR